MNSKCRILATPSAELSFLPFKTGFLLLRIKAVTRKAAIAKAIAEREPRVIRVLNKELETNRRLCFVCASNCIGLIRTILFVVEWNCLYLAVRFCCIVVDVAALLVVLEDLNFFVHILKRFFNDARSHNTASYRIELGNALMSTKDRAKYLFQ